MEFRVSVLLLIFVFFGFQKVGNTVRLKRHLLYLDFRKMMKVFVRYNVKVNVVPYTSTFAFAMGFRANFDIKPTTIIHPKRKTSQEKYQYSQNLNNQNGTQYQKQYYTDQNQYQGWYQPQHQYQREIHSAVQSAFEWHGLNGSACLQRTLCEVSLIYHDDIISQILRVIFNGTKDLSCPEEIPCPLSFVELIDHIFTGNTGVIVQ